MNIRRKEETSIIKRKCHSCQQQNTRWNIRNSDIRIKELHNIFKKILLYLNRRGKMWCQHQKVHWNSENTSKKALIHFLKNKGNSSECYVISVLQYIS